MRTLLIIILFWGVSFAAPAANLPTSIEINYQIETIIGHAELNETMTITQKSGVSYYRIFSEARALGLLKLIKPGSITRHSHGSITTLGLRPDEFSDQRGKKKPGVAIFNWQDSLLTIQYKDQEKIETLPVGTLDNLSIFYHFMFAPPLSQEFIDIPLTDGRSLKLTRYIVSREIIETPLGELSTIALTRQSEEDNTIKKIWLAPSHHMLPVRIVSIGKNGLELEQTVTEINVSYLDRSKINRTDESRKLW